MLNEYALQSIARERLSQLHEAAAHAKKAAEARPPLRVRVAAWMIKTGHALLHDEPTRPTFVAKSPLAPAHDACERAGTTAF